MSLSFSFIFRSVSAVTWNEFMDRTHEVILAGPYTSLSMMGINLYARKPGSYDPILVAVIDPQGAKWILQDPEYQNRPGFDHWFVTAYTPALTPPKELKRQTILVEEPCSPSS